MAKRRWAIIYTFNSLGTTITRCVETDNITVTMASKAADQFARKQPEFEKCKYYQVKMICETELDKLQALHRQFMFALDKIMGKEEA